MTVKELIEELKKKLEIQTKRADLAEEKLRKTQEAWQLADDRFDLHHGYEYGDDDEEE